MENKYPMTFLEYEDGRQEARVWEQFETVHRVTRQLTTNVDYDTYNIILYWPMEEAKSKIYQILRQNQWEKITLE